MVSLCRKSLSSASELFRNVNVKSFASHSAPPAFPGAFLLRDNRLAAHRRLGRRSVYAQSKPVPRQVSMFEETNADLPLFSQTARRQCRAVRSKPASHQRNCGMH